MNVINLEKHAGRVSGAELMDLRTKLLALMYPEDGVGICEGWYDAIMEKDGFTIAFPNSGRFFVLTCSVCDKDIFPDD